MAKDRHRHVISMDNKYIDYDYRLKSRGQKFALSGAGMLTLLSGFLGFLGHDVAAATVISIGLVGYVGIFITGKYQSQESKSQKQIKKNDGSKEKAP